MPQKSFLNEKTEGMCSECLKPSAASVYVEDGSVMMEKTCPQHGRQVAVIEKDPEFYRTLSQHDEGAGRVDSGVRCLVIPVEYRCNLKCFFCAVPHRSKKNLSVETLTRIVNNYDGQNIELSGGEPTLREELFEIIRMVKAAGKKCVLVTSGLKLADSDYVARLKDAGLDQVFISLYSGTDEIEEKMCGRDVLGEKLAAMRAVRKAGLDLAISAVIVPGVNDEDIGGIFRVAFENDVKFMSMRTVARVGDYADGERLHLSQLVEKVGRALGVSKRELLAAKRGRWTPYFFYLRLSKARRGRGVYAHEANVFARMRNVARYVRDVGVLNSLPALLGRMRGEGLFQVLHIRLAAWPDRFDYEASQIGYGKFDHLYGEEPMEIFRALILGDEL